MLRRLSLIGGAPPRVAPANDVIEESARILEATSANVSTTGRVDWSAIKPRSNNKHPQRELWAHRSTHLREGSTRRWTRPWGT